jgi:transcription elongation factor Elf1
MNYGSLLLEFDCPTCFGSTEVNINTPELGEECVTYFSCSECGLGLQVAVRIEEDNRPRKEGS